MVDLVQTADVAVERPRKLRLLLQDLPWEVYHVLKAVVHALLVGSSQSYRWFVNPNPRFCQVLLDPGGSCCYSGFPCSKSRNFGDWVEIQDSCSKNMDLREYR